MIKHSLILSIIVISTNAGILRPDGPPCPQGDGLYAVGCSSRYLQCVNGNEYEQTCPEGLYFDRLLSRCERRQAINNCNRGRKFSNRRQKAVVINCKDLASGDYPLEEGICDENYYQCSNGIGYMRKCPYNQVFSGSLKRCDYLENCNQSNGHVKNVAGSAQAPSSYSNSEVTTEEMEYVPNGIDCKYLNNATISHSECSTFFWQCAQEKLYKKKCPQGLFYDAERILCDFAVNVKGCPEYSGVGSPSPPPVQSESDKEENTVFDCNGKLDGVYEIGHCDRKFASCNEGNTRIVDCADHLVYDPRISACDYPEACKSERKQEDIPPLFNHGGIADKTEQQPNVVEYDCNGKSNGLYVKEACDGEYTQCNNNVAFVMKCPANLVFNMKSKTCDHKENCDKEYKEDSTSEETATTTKVYEVPEATSQKSESETEATTITSTSTSQPIKFSCDNLSDGNYAAGRCDNKFYSCWNGQVTQLKCPSTLVYNPYQSQCDYESNVSDCNPETAHSTDSDATTPPSAGQYRPIDPFCERLADGIYSEGCSKFYYKCANFETTKIYCPPGLFFNRERGVCDNSENIVDCQQTTQTGKDSQDTSPAHAETITTTTVIPTTTRKSPQVQFSCAGRVDGIYALPFCSQDYIQCVNGNSIVSSCSTGLVYSESTGLCDYKENSPICNKQDTIADSACSGKKDGYYSDGCSTTYFSCIGEKMRKMKCPQNLVFSQKKAICDYPNDTEECTAPESTPLQTPPVVPTEFCQGKKNGLFEYEKCSPHYVVCDNGIAISGTCAAPLIFNSSTELCDYKIKNEHCSSNDLPISPSSTKTPVYY